MSLFIRVDCSFFHHRKTNRLRALIENDALWVPPALWAFAAEYQPDGDFKDYSDKELAISIGYTGNAQALLQALLQAGFLDKNKKIHDWAIHNEYHTSHSEKARKAAVARWEKERIKKESKRREERGSASSIAPSITEHRISTFDKLKEMLSAEYKRPNPLSWKQTLAEQVLELSKRPTVFEELSQLQAFRKTAQFFPESIDALVERWDQTLDRSRNNHQPRINQI